MTDFEIYTDSAQALMFGLNFEQMVAWIVAGLYWDGVHCIGNIAAGILVYPLSEFLKKLFKKDILVG